MEKIDDSAYVIMSSAINHAQGYAHSLGHGVVDIPDLCLLSGVWLTASVADYCCSLWSPYGIGQTIIFLPTALREALVFKLLIGRF